MNKDYETYDLWLATYLHVCGVPLVRLIPGAPYQGFLFDDHAGQATRAAQDYGRGTANAPVRPLLTAYKALRQLLHEKAA